MRASARAGVGAAGLALVGCGDDDDDDAAVAQVEEQAEEQAQVQAEEEMEEEQAQAQVEEEMEEEQAEPAVEEEEAEEQAEEQAEQAEPEEEEEEPAATAGLDLNASVVGAWGALPGNLDQGNAGARGGQSASNSYHYASVFPLTPSGSATPGGLGEWEFIDDTALVVTITDGRVFHNGEPVTAADVKFSIDRLSNRAEYNLDYPSAWAGELSWAGAAELVDDKTIRIPQADTSVDAANSLALGGFPVFNQAYVEEVGDEGMGQFPISIGPFKFVEWRPDEFIRSVRNDDFYNDRDFEFAPHLPFIQSVEARLVPEVGARLAALEAGEIDIAMSIPPELATELEGDDFNVHFHPAQRGLHLKLPMTLAEDPKNPGQPNPWADKRVRAAANLAVDVDAITQNIMTGREDYTYTLSSGQFGFPPDIADQRWGFDPEQARQLLAEAGYADGIETDLTYLSGLYTNDALFMQAIAEMWRDVGFIVNLIPQDISENLEQARNKEIPGPFLFPQPAGFTPLGSFALDVRSDGSYAHAVEVLSPEREEVDRLIAAAQIEFDSDKRQALFEDIVRIHYLDASWVFLFELVQTHVSTSRLEWTPYFKQPASVELWGLRALA